MPKALEKKLKAEAKKRGYGEERTNRYVYGTLAKVRQRTKAKKQRKK